MSIMIDKIDHNQIQDLFGKTPSRSPNPSEQLVSTPGENASLQVDYEVLINQAIKEAQQDDTKAVERARELLASGELESPDNFRDAAENIINFGI
ncbi:MAG: hypothetical protein ACYTBV_02550 [Planctomycetota bacterium]